MTAALVVSPNPAGLGGVTAAVVGTGFSNRKTRLLLDGVGATTNIFRPRIDGSFAVGINLRASAGTQTLIAQQCIGNTWTTVATAPPVVIADSHGGGTDPLPTARVGFGKDAQGGAGLPIVMVSNLNNSGPGSLRAAFGSNRLIKFDPHMSGTITFEDGAGGLNGAANWGLDGSSAAAQGIDIAGYGIDVTDNHDVRLAHLATRDMDDSSFRSGFTFRKSYKIYLEHLSADGYDWRGLDLFDTVRDVTVAWCLLGPKGPDGDHNYPMLAGKFVDRISVDHVFFIGGETRMPQADYDNADGAGPVPSGVTMDIANSLMWSEDPDYFSLVTAHGNAKVNVRNSYLYGPVAPGENHAMHGETGAKIFQSGCVGKGSTNILPSAAFRSATAFPVASGAVLPLESTAQVAANACKAGAGRFPRDARDASYAAAVSIT